MKISDTKKCKLYARIAEPITNLRIELGQNHYMDSDLDFKLSQLSDKIWAKIKAELNIK